MQVKRVVVGVNGSAGSLVALRYGAGLAWARARAADAGAGLDAARGRPGGSPVPVLRNSGRPGSGTRRGRLEQAIGWPSAARRPGSEFAPQTVRGQAGPALASIAGRAGRHPRDRDRAARLAGPADRLPRRPLLPASQPLPGARGTAPAELADASHGLRGWMGRHRSA